MSERLFRRLENSLIPKNYPNIAHGKALRPENRRAAIRSPAHGVFPSSHTSISYRILPTSVGADGATIRYYIDTIPIELDYIILLNTHLDAEYQYHSHKDIIKRHTTSRFVT